MTTYAVYLRPKTSFASPVGSDTLFGALCWAVRALGGANKLEPIIDQFKAAAASGVPPPFAISSTFPFLHNNGEEVRLYPKPLISEPTRAQLISLAERERQRHSVLRQFQRGTVAALERVRQIKGATYVSEEICTQIARGKFDAHGLCEQLVERASDDADIVRWGNSFITHGERKRVQAKELNAFSAEMDTQRNEIERVSLATVEGRLFFSHETFLHRARAGLWFVLRTADLDFIKPLLRYLADTGIGGDRSVGKGHFHISLDQIHEHTLPAADTPNCFVTLSRYIPADDECDFSREPLSYALTTIRPKHEAKLAGVGHRTYKCLMRVFEPGSFFPFDKQKEVYGEVIPVGSRDSAGSFETYHSGLAIPIFAKMGGGA